MKASSVEILIKSFMRFDVLKEYVESIRGCYPDNKIIVADDTGWFDKKCENELLGMGVEIHKLPEDVGLSAGRNHLVKQVKSPYFLLTDDDHIVLNENYIDEMMDCLLRTNASVASALTEDGVCSYWFGHFTIEDGFLWRNFYETELKEMEVGFCPNFFVADTEKFRKSSLMWDEKFKMVEHDDFFLRKPKSLKITHMNKAMIRRSGKRESNPNYNAKRQSNLMHYKGLLRSKYQLLGDPKERKITWDGGIPNHVPRRIKLV